MVPGFVIPFRLIGLKLGTFVSAMLPQLLLTAGMALLCWIWLHVLDSMSVTNPWVQLLSTSLLGAVVYAGSMLLIWPTVMQHLENALSTSQKGMKLADFLSHARRFCLRGIPG